MNLLNAELASTGNAFPTYKSKGQAVSQVDCGNGEIPLNVWCQNTASQIQGDEVEVGIAGAQGVRDEGGDCQTCG